MDWKLLTVNLVCCSFIVLGGFIMFHNPLFGGICAGFGVYMLSSVKG